ncbi:MAG: hypothetical protein KGH75_00310 [Rhodospirillales bacterium]|nr:hypothetical protein [Rhodospirillales bacterium]
MTITIDSIGTTDEDGYTVDRWICKSKRLDSDNKMYYCWLDHTGTERRFSKVKGTVGNEYLIRHKTDPEGLHVRGEPVWIGRASEPGDPEVAGWEAQERAEIAMLERLRLQRNAERDSELETMLVPLREAYGRLVGTGRRSAFIAAVIEGVTR